MAVSMAVELGFTVAMCGFESEYQTSGCQADVKLAGKKRLFLFQRPGEVH